LPGVDEGIADNSRWSDELGEANVLLCCHSHFKGKHGNCGTTGMPTNAHTVEACTESQSEIVTIGSSADLQLFGWHLEAMFYARESLPANRGPLSSCIELQERRRTHILDFDVLLLLPFCQAHFIGK
jgi:hypothetical protein